MLGDQDPAHVLGAVAAIAAATGALVTKSLELLVRRHKERRDENSEDRRALSEDERAFRKELREEIQRLRAELDQIRTELRECNERHEAAQRRISELEDQMLCQIDLSNNRRSQ